MDDSHSQCIRRGDTPDIAGNKATKQIHVACGIVAKEPDSQLQHTGLAHQGRNRIGYTVGVSNSEGACGACTKHGTLARAAAHCAAMPSTTATIRTKCQQVGWLVGK